MTFGRHDLVCSTRFADALTGGIAGAELEVFEDCSHAPIYENVQAFNTARWRSCKPTEDTTERYRPGRGLMGLSPVARAA